MFKFSFIKTKINFAQLYTYNFNIEHAHRHQYDVEWQKPKNRSTIYVGNHTENSNQNELLTIGTKHFENIFQSVPNTYSKILA